MSFMRIGLRWVVSRVKVVLWFGSATGCGFVTTSEGYGWRLKMHFGKIVFLLLSLWGRFWVELIGYC